MSIFSIVQTYQQLSRFLNLPTYVCQKQYYKPCRICMETRAIGANHGTWIQGSHILLNLKGVPLDIKICFSLSKVVITWVCHYSNVGGIEAIHFNSMHLHAKYNGHVTAVRIWGIKSSSRKPIMHLRGSFWRETWKAWLMIDIILFQYLTSLGHLQNICRWSAGVPPHLGQSGFSLQCHLNSPRGVLWTQWITESCDKCWVGEMETKGTYSKTDCHISPSTVEISKDQSLACIFAYKINIGSLFTQKICEI